MMHRRCRRLSSSRSLPLGSLGVAAMSLLLALGGMPTAVAAASQDRPKPDVRREQPTPRPAPAPRPVDQRPVPQDGGPRISVETEELDFGITYDESKLDGVIRFTNTGDTLLLIQNVRTSCGCTAAALLKREYAPGESGEIEVGFSPTGAGRQVKTVTIVTNDPTSPAAVVRVAATLVPLVEIADPTLRLGQVEQGREHVVPLELFSRDPNFRVLSVNFDDATNISWREVPNAKPAVENPQMPGFRLIELVIDANTPSGNFNRTLTLDLAAQSPDAVAPKDLNYTVRMFGVILGDFNVEPRFMRIPRVDPGGEFEASVVVVSRSGRPFEIMSVEVESRQMQMFVREHHVSHEQVELPDGRTGVRVTLRGTAGSRVGAFRGDITLRTDRETEPTVTVTANGQVRPLQPVRNENQRPAPPPRPVPVPR